MVTYCCTILCPIYSDVLWFLLLHIDQPAAWGEAGYTITTTFIHAHHCIGESAGKNGRRPVMHS